MDYKELTVKKGRAAVVEALKALNAELRSGFEHTTHGSFHSRGCDLDTVLDGLKKFWDTPDAYTVSELSQRIEGFIKQQEAPRPEPRRYPAGPLLLGGWGK